MKNSKYIIMLFLIAGAACNKTVEQRAVPEFEPTSIDNNGGNWKPVLLTSGGEVVIAAPDATGSAAYQAEITTILNMQSNLSGADRRIIDKWKSSGVIKWNEMSRLLVAKYNLAPEANPDGTYPAPSAANPAAYPNFPFSNPPYASRAYAYMSAAIYDAMVSCWKYKFQYNRKSPSVNDSRVQALETIQTDLPSYPSEDAVVAQVGYRMLKAFFPLDSVALLNMATEQKKAKMLSGAASATDIAAGEAIANYVSDKFLARSRTDGMGTAGGNPTLWAQLAAAAQGRGIATTWASLEVPARPPQLPFFMNVMTWNFTTAQRDSMRPPPPPAIGSPEFITALAEVKSYNKENSDKWRIAMYWADGLGTFSPPGHWNEIATSYIIKNKMNELRIARTFSLLNMAMMDAGISCWYAKSYYYYPRPSQMDRSIKTIGLPNFPSYTSGHSTFSAAAATVLGYIFPQNKNEFDAMATEASLSRIYGGIHYRFDCVEGLKNGVGVGTFAVRRGQADGSN